MDAIRIDVTGVRQVGLRFDEFPDALYDALKDEINTLANELLARVQAATPVKTGRLRSEERVRLFTDPSRISGYVDIAGEKGSQDIPKAVALEYGAGAATKVRTHAMLLDHHWSLKLAEPQAVIVRAYTRTADIAEVAFERGPLAQMQPEIVARLNAVVAKATAGVNG